MFDPKEIAQRDFVSEFEFQTSRSSGPGGQNVNKVETRVSLKFHVQNSQLLSDLEKERLLKKWNSKLNNDGFIAIHSEKYRSQLQNKEETITLFRQLVEKAFTDPKPRKKTKPSKAAAQKRIEKKRKLGEKKAMRKPPKF